MRRSEEKRSGVKRGAHLQQKRAVALYKETTGWSCHAQLDAVSALGEHERRGLAGSQRMREIDRVRGQRGNDERMGR